MESTAEATAFSIPRFKTMGLAPAATFFIPRFTMALASTVAVVVPSPATSLVLVATSLASWAPMFSQGSSSSTSLAMVTPSLVMVGAPQFLPSTTFRPFGPSVMATESASLSTPASSARRASSPNLISLTVMSPPNRESLLDDGQHVARRQDQVLLGLDLDLGAAVLRVDDLLPDLHVHGDALSLLEPARADRHDLPLLGTLFGRVGDDPP